MTLFPKRWGQLPPVDFVTSPLCKLMDKEAYYDWLGHAVDLFGLEACEHVFVA